MNDGGVLTLLVIDFQQKNAPCPVCAQGAPDEADGQVQENVLEIGIDEYQDYEQRMQLLIGPKKYEKPQYVANIGNDTVADSPDLEGGSDNDG